MYKESFELFNINQDFSEKRNLITQYPQIAEDLKENLMGFRLDALSPSRQKKTKLEEKLENLKSLGYIR